VTLALYVLEGNLPLHGATDLGHHLAGDLVRFAFGQETHREIEDAESKHVDVEVSHVLQANSTDQLHPFGVIVLLSPASPGDGNGSEPSDQADIVADVGIKVGIIIEAEDVDFIL